MKDSLYDNDVPEERPKPAERTEESKEELINE
jgi:hypothetical protein